MPLLQRGYWVTLALAFAAMGAGPSETRVVDAAQARNAKAVLALVKRGVDVNVPQPDGATALHWAAHWDDLETARILVAAGARANAANDYGATPIFLAATNGSAQMLGLLLDAGAEANAVLPTGETVLMTAVRSGNASAVRRLLAGGANVNAPQTSMGQTALMWAAAGGWLDAARALIEYGADVNAHSTSGFTPLMFAARVGDIELNRLLIDSKADINASDGEGNTPLLVATVRGHANLALFLLEQGAKPDGNAADAGYTPLHWACSIYENPVTDGSIDLLRDEWKSIAGIPDEVARVALIKALIARGAKLEARLSGRMPAPSRYTFGGAPRAGSTPFLVAATSGDGKVMRLLIANGADPFARTDDGATPLMAIVSGGNAFIARRVSEDDRIEAIQLALDLGADLEAADAKGYRAMHLAASSEFHSIIKFLLSKGADLNPITMSRREREGTGFVVIPGQSPLGIVEGTFNGGTYNERPETAAFLRSLGAKSVGRVTLESYMETFDELNAKQK